MPGKKGVLTHDGKPSAMKKYYSSVQISGRYIEVGIFPSGIRLCQEEQDYEPPPKPNDYSELMDAAPEDNRGKVLYRARKRLHDLVLSNEDKFSKLLTLTYERESVSSLLEAYPHLSSFIKRFKKNYNLSGEKFNYIFIPELQKRGTVHFHGMLQAPVIHWTKYLKTWGLGRVKIEGIRDKENLGRYLAKYISKDIGVSEQMYSAHNKTFIKSLNLKDLTEKHHLGNSSRECPDYIAEVLDYCKTQDCVQRTYHEGENEHLGKYIKISYLLNPRGGFHVARKLNTALSNGEFRP